MKGKRNTVKSVQEDEDAIRRQENQEGTELKKERREMRRHSLNQIPKNTKNRRKTMFKKIGLKNKSKTKK